jgi:hypothetical protein
MVVRSWTCKSVDGDGDNTPRRGWNRHPTLELRIHSRISCRSFAMCFTGAAIAATPIEHDKDISPLPQYGESPSCSSKESRLCFPYSNAPKRNNSTISSIAVCMVCNNNKQQSSHHQSMYARVKADMFQNTFMSTRSLMAMHQ